MDNIEESFYFSDGAESLDSLDHEELEIALYSQIHFEPNSETTNAHNVKFDKDFDISVEGNEKTDSKTSTINSNVVLDNKLRQKYENAVANAYIGVGSDSDDSAILIEESPSDDNNDDIQLNTSSHKPGRYMYAKITDMLDDNNDDSNHWAINMEDTKKGGFQYGRYHKPVKCHNCNKTGHLSKNCPQPKKAIVCSLCSDEGHICRTCPSSFCFNCEEQGHGSNSCRAPRGMWRRVCKRCNLQGHILKNCPELWRQYHITTMPGKLQKLNIVKKKRKKSCYNCGERGHYGHECDEDRFTRFLQINSPFITRYQHVNEYLDVMHSDRSDVVYENTREITSEQKRKIFEESNAEENKDRKPSEYLHMLKKSGKTGRNNFDKMSFTIKNSNFEIMSDTNVRRRKRKGRKDRVENATGKSQNCKDSKQNAMGRSQNCDSSKADTKCQKNMTLPNGGMKSNRALPVGDKKNVLPINQPDEDLPRNFKSDIQTERGKQSYDLRHSKSKSESTMSIEEKLDEPPRKKGRTVSFDKNSGNDMKINVNVTPVKNVTKVKHRDNTQRSKNEKRNFTSEDLFSIHSIDIPSTLDESKHKKEPKVKISSKHRSHRNDKFASEDLFSLEKMMKTKNSSYLEDYVEEDVNHQVHSNEWWNKNKRKNAKKRKNKKANKLLRSANS